MKYPNSLNLNNSFIPWQPSTWPEPPEIFNDEFKQVLERIFRESLLNEIENVINDAPTLEHRGHVIALSILCAIDALSSYAFNDLRAEKCQNCGRSDRVGPRYKKYVEEFFSEDYKPYAEKIYKLYRNSITHSWNLFQAAMLPGNEQIREKIGVIVLGLKNFFQALNSSLDIFLDRLKCDKRLQKSALARYKWLKQSARPG